MKTCVSLSKQLTWPITVAPDKLLTAPLPGSLGSTDMPPVRHRRPDDLMRRNACRVTKTSPGLTFRPAADETDPRVHVFVSFPSHLHMQTGLAYRAAAARTEAADWSARCVRGANGRAGPRRSRPLPDTLPWEKQHGPDRWLYRLHTHTPHVQRISCSLPDESCWIYRWTQTGEFKPSRSILGRYALRSLINTSTHHRLYIYISIFVCARESVCVWERGGFIILICIFKN